MNDRPTDWMRIANESDVPSPALLIYPDRVVENLRRMAANAGGADRLRPHVKTHKLPQIVALELAEGITKFKAATIAEMEMCAASGAPDVLLAYQPVGPNVRRLLSLVGKFPRARLSCVADDAGIVSELSRAATEAGTRLDVFLDLNVGMNRTGIPPGTKAAELYATISRAPGLRAAGLHAYDGHLHSSDHELLVRKAEETLAPVWRLRAELEASGLEVPTVVAGGTPTSPLHARHERVEVSGGVSVLWDFGQEQNSPDLRFLSAAVVLTRVISCPQPNRLCLDLGYKAIASESPHPRVKLFGLEEATSFSHSEEHLEVETSRAGEFPVGSVLYGIPRHICPTVALYEEAVAVRRGLAAETWRVVARARRITV